MAKANRTHIIHKRKDGDITLDEAREVLGPYGKLSRVEFLDAKVQETLQFPKSVVAEFEKYDPNRD